MQYCEKQPELLARLQRPTVRFTDSQGVDGVSNRLPQGRKKESRYGTWGFYGVPPLTGPDLATQGFTTFNQWASATALAVGDVPPGGLSSLISRHSNTAIATAYSSNVGSFTPLSQTYWRPSVWANDWLTGNLKFGELRVNPGANGLLGSDIQVSIRNATIPYSSGAVDESVGTAGNYTYFETPDIAMGTGSSDISMFRQSGGGAFDETGKLSFWLLKTIRSSLAATRYGEVSAGWGGATWDMHDDEAGQTASTQKYLDAHMDQLFTITPIQGDYATGGKSGKVVAMLGTNGYTPGNQAQLKTWVNNWIARVRASLTRVGKGSSDVLIELVLPWDTTLDRPNYNATTEQVKVNEMDAVYRAVASENTALHSKVAYTPLGLEVRARHGALPSWTSIDGSTGYLAGSGDFTHPNSIGALYFPTVEVDLYLRSQVSTSRVSMRTGLGLV